MDKSKKNSIRHISIRNKRASFDYAIGDRYSAGLVLVGPEIKSIRAGKASLADSYCFFEKGELWAKGIYIATYAFTSYNRQDERRDRKLLLNKRELRKLQSAVKNKGTTIVPLELFINDRGLAKLVIGEAVGRKKYDKRVVIREREEKRKIADAMRH